ncbi:MAG: hypothetical protein AB2L22_12960 [Syntrophales bacterium]
MKSNKNMKSDYEINDTNRLSSGNLIVDRISFKQSCWYELEESDNPLIYIVADKIFKNDKALNQYLRICFENILQKMIYDLTPGLETRKRQLDRILCSICDQKKHPPKIILSDKEDDNDTKADAETQYYKKSRLIHILKNFEKYNSPPDRQSLKELSREIQVPDFIYSKKSDSRRGPYVEDQEMSKYVERIIQIAGGAVYYDDLLDLIIDRFNLIPIRISTDRIDSDDDDETYIYDLVAKQENKYPIAYEHKEIAELIWQKMSYEDRKLFYFSFVCEYKGKDIAPLFNVSAATISERLKDIRQLFHDSLDTSDFTVDECRAVLEIIGYLALEEFYEA